MEGTERFGVEALLAAGERAGELSEVEDELFRFGQVAAGDPRLGAILGDSTVDFGRRSRLVHDLLDGKARPLTVRLVEVALAGFGGRGFAAGLTRLVEMAALRRDREVAYVTSAVALSEDEERRLGELLAKVRRAAVPSTANRGRNRALGGHTRTRTCLRRRRARPSGSFGRS